MYGAQAAVMCSHFTQIAEAEWIVPQNALPNIESGFGNLPCGRQVHKSLSHATPLFNDFFASSF